MLTAARPLADPTHSGHGEGRNAHVAANLKRASEFPRGLDRLPTSPSTASRRTGSRSVSFIPNLPCIGIIAHGSYDGHLGSYLSREVKISYRSLQITLRKPREATIRIRRCVTHISDCCSRVVDRVVVFALGELSC